MKSRILKVVPALIAVTAAGVVFCYDHVKPTGVEISDTLQAETDTQAVEIENVDFDGDNEIWVYVCGAVNEPGVFLMDKGSRLFEAIERAGGFSENAVREYLNLALPVEDGQQIFVPDDTDPDPEMITDAHDDGLININTADLSELMTLPGIGEVRGEAIIEYRKKHPFQSVEDIMNVSGIKENSFSRIKDLIKV